MNKNLILELELETQFPDITPYILNFYKTFKRLPKEKEWKFYNQIKNEFTSRSNVQFIDTQLYNAQFIDHSGVVCGLQSRCGSAKNSIDNILGGIRNAKKDVTFIISFVTEDTIFYDIIVGKNILTVNSMYE